MRFIPILILLCVLFLSAIPAASAQNASFSNLGLGGDEDLLIYSYNGTTGTQSLIGQYNTSSVNVPLPESDFQIVVKPSALRNAFDPMTLIGDIFVFVQNNIIPLAFIVFLLALWLGRR